MSAILFSLATLFSICAGGLFALKLRNRLHLLSFTIGVLVGVVSFKILPEIFKLTYETRLDLIVSPPE